MTQLVLNRTATIGICGPLDVETPGLERIGVGSVELIPVAAPDHPLALAGRNSPGAGRDHIQLVLTDRSPLAQGEDRGVIGTQTWRLADLGSKHMLLKEGIGWGYMPEPMVRDDLQAGLLVKQGCSSDLTCVSTRTGSCDCTRSTGRIRRPARRAPGSLPGSRLRRQGRSKPTIAVPCLAHRLVGEKNKQPREEQDTDTPVPGGRLATFMSVA